MFVAGSIPVTSFENQHRGSMNQCLEAYEGMWLDNPGFKKSLINYSGPGVPTPGSFHFTYNEERKYKGLYYMGDMSLIHLRDIIQDLPGQCNDGTISVYRD